MQECTFQDTLSVRILQAIRQLCYAVVVYRLMPELTEANDQCVNGKRGMRKTLCVTCRTIDPCVRQSFFRSATDDSSGRRSAVKKLTDVFATTHAARRAYRELMSLTSMRHDNVSLQSNDTRLIAFRLGV
jgi:hypothetical protein